MVQESKILQMNHFNSHPHEEDDVLLCFVVSATFISTHILTKRMTVFTWYVCYCICISTHILTKRMTARLELRMYMEHFNSHPHEEDDVT